MLLSLAMIPLNVFGEALSIFENYKVNTKYDLAPILNYFKKTWVMGRFSPCMWNYFNFIGRKTNNDVEGFNRYLNKYLNSAHPTIFRFIDHLKIIESQVVLKLTDFKRNPLDFAHYNKPNKKIKEEFMFERLKQQYSTGNLSLSDYMYAIASNQTSIEYIPEWLVIEGIQNEQDDLVTLNNAVMDVSIEELTEAQKAIIEQTEAELASFTN